MAIVNTSIAPLLKEGSNVTLTQDGQVITIATTGGGGTPSGSDTQIQFNDGGAFGGDAGLTYDKTNNIVDLESIDFATTPTAAAATYRLNADDSEGSLNLGLKGGNVNIALGAEVVIMSYNAEATTLNKGEVVYLYGAQGQRPSIKRASNTADSTSAATFGMVAESIASGAEGFVIQVGVLRNIDTNAYNEGDILWLGSTAGSVTTTKPYAPNHGVFVGVVLKKNATSGRIFVKPQNGYEMDELHNVSAQSPSNNDILAYNTSTSLWEKKQLSAISGITGTGTTNYLSKFTGASTIGNSTIQDLTTGVLVSPSVTASGAIARGLNHTPSLTAAANNDVLVGLDINPTFTNGAFTGVTNFPLRITSGLTNLFRVRSDGEFFIDGSKITINGSAAHYATITSSATALDIQTFSNTPIRVNNAGGGAVTIATMLTASSGLTLGNGTSNGMVINATSSSTGKTIQSYGGHPLILNSAGNNVLIGTSTDSGFKLDVNGLVNFTGTTASDGGQLGAELLSAAGWTSTGWTGSFGAGWTHTTGNTTALTNTLAAVNGNYYQITYTVTGRTAGTFVIAFGGYTSGSLSATGNVGPRATSTGTLSITPTTDFDGTIVISIKAIGASSASVSFKNSAGTVTNEIRNATNSNTLIGLNAGRQNLGTNNTIIGQGSGVFNTTGIDNSFFGRNSGNFNTIGRANSFFGSSSGFNNIEGIYNNFYGYLSGFTNTSGNFNNFFGAQSGYLNTTGSNNSFFGESSGYNNTTGGANSFFGHQSGNKNTTGSNNSSFGFLSGFNNTTGSNNSFFGRDAGRLISSGSNLTVANNSVFLGYDTRANADSETNQLVIGYQAIGLGSNTTVIGNSSTTYGRWWGNLLIGTSTNSGYALDVSGTARIQNDLTISDTRNIILSTTTGTKIGTATTQKIGFFNATPVVQPSAVTTAQGIADALSSLGLLASSTVTITDDELESAFCMSSFNYTQR